MAVIYDLSSITFSMSIDELDISKVKTGQTVQITAERPVMRPSGDCGKCKPGKRQ